MADQERHRANRRGGGIVILARFGTNLLDGLSFRVQGMPPVFFMNKDVPGDRFRFSLAHELGHMVMHSMPDNDQKMDPEAHASLPRFLCQRLRSSRIWQMRN